MLFDYLRSLPSVPLVTVEIRLPNTRGTLARLHNRNWQCYSIFFIYNK